MAVVIPPISKKIEMYVVYSFELERYKGWLDTLAACRPLEVSAVQGICCCFVQ